MRERDEGSEDSLPAERLISSNRALTDRDALETNDQIEHEEIQSLIDRTPRIITEESSLTHVPAFLWLLSCSAGLGGLLFGYDTGVISSALVSFKSDLDRELTTLDKSLVTSVTSLTALLASPLAPFIADALGRKTVVLLTDLLFIMGAVWQALSVSVFSIILGRAIVGLAIGAAAFVTPLYISELSPGPSRGRLVTIYTLFLTGGQVLAYFIGWLLSATPAGWRLMLGLGALPAALQVLTLFTIPETPRWLIKAGHHGEAEKVLRKMHSGTEDLDIVVANLIECVRGELSRGDLATAEADVGQKTFHWSSVASAMRKLKMLFSDSGNRKALAIACMLQGFQQLVGFNSLMYFSATIFSELGFDSPTLTSLSIATTNFTFTVAAFYTIDRLGRRLSLLSSIPFMSGALALCALAFHFLSFENSATIAPSQGYNLNESTTVQRPAVWLWLIVMSTIVYTAAYAIGLGCVPWQQSELFPLHVRAVGVGLATATNWSANFLVGVTFLPLMGYSPSATFAIYTVICLTAWFAVWKIYPETAGLSLEEANRLLAGHGWGVNESTRRWRINLSKGQTR